MGEEGVGLGKIEGEKKIDQESQTDTEKQKYRPERQTERSAT